jgi:hypothetical protein
MALDFLALDFLTLDFFAAIDILLNVKFVSLGYDFWRSKMSL